jgi:putative MATE family efflux protein
MKASNDLTVGKPIKVILLFTLPIIAGNLFQQLYNVIDTVIVGHILGEDALAALGATSAVYSLFTSIAYGMTNGFSIIIARHFGGKDFNRMNRAVAHTMILSVVLGLVMTVIAVAFIRPLLIFLRTPDEILEQAYRYIRIVLLFLIVTMIYNMFAAILRGIGNSFMPLVFLIISSVCNVGLDILLVGFAGMGVEGASTATVIAQLISVILCAVYLVVRCPQIHIRKSDFHWNAKIGGDLFTAGLSMAMMFSVVSVGSIALQSAINSLGAITIAAHTAARKISELLMMAFSSLSMTASTFASQNLGAGKRERIGQGMRATFILAFVIVVLENIFIFATAEPLVKMVTGSGNQQLIDTAVYYLHINLPFYPALAILVILRSALQGLNHKKLPLVASTIELVGKFVVAGLLVPRIGYLGICISEPVIWIIGGIVVSVDYYLVKKQFRSDRFKDNPIA